MSAGADILLTHGYFLGEDAHERRYMRPYPPLGLLYLSAWLKSRDIGVDVLDTTFAERESARGRIAAHPAPVVGLYTNLMTRSQILDLTAAAKAAGKHVVLGGPESAGYPEAYLRHGADVVVFGEGEIALEELVEALGRRGPHRLEDVAGIAYRDESGAVVTTAPRAPIPDLAALPWPDRGAIDLGEYLNCWRTHHGQGAVSLITARGCPFKCRWCSHAVFGYTHRRRPALDVANEVAVIRERYAPELLWFADDVFTINHRWLREFAAHTKALGTSLPFETITRADRVTSEVVTLMAELGCYRVWLGSESGSQRILDAMDRGVTTEQVTEATKALQAAGIRVGLFLMWGYEGESGDDIDATIRHVRATAPDDFLTTVAYPIRGTPYFDDVADRIALDIPWEDASDRAHAVRGRPSKRYYGFATRRLRNEVAWDAARALPSGRSATSLARAAAGVAGARVGMWWTRRKVEA